MSDPTIILAEDPADLARLDTALATSRALIADGHHRYAAYLRMQQLRPGPAVAMRHGRPRQLARLLGQRGEKHNYCRFFWCRLEMLRH